MKTVKHPTIPGITRTVTNKEFTRWQKAGWVDMTPAAVPAESKRTEAPKTGASPVPSRSRTAARKKG